MCRLTNSRSAAGPRVTRARQRRATSWVQVRRSHSAHLVQPSDLPITKGLQESIHDFQGIDQEVELQPILDQLAARPPLDLSLGEEVEARLPAIVGGLSVALARTFGTIDPNLKNPRTEQWERAFRVFNLLL